MEHRNTYGGSQHQNYYAPTIVPQSYSNAPSTSSFAYPDQPPIASTSSAMPGYMGYPPSSHQPQYPPPSVPGEALSSSQRATERTESGTPEQRSLTSSSACKDSIAGPSRTGSSGGHAHRRDLSAGGQAAFGGAGVRHPAGPYQRPEGASHSVKASSTTSLFTTRKNWSEHILQEMQVRSSLSAASPASPLSAFCHPSQSAGAFWIRPARRLLSSTADDFMHVLSPTGHFIFATPCIRELAQYTSDELFGRSLFDYIHPDDVAAFKRDFEASLRSSDTLTLYYRFRTKDDRYLLFEMTGHPYYAEESGPNAQPPVPKCFFAMARPYPSKNAAMLDSFLELKFENERLRQELLAMYKACFFSCSGSIRMTLNMLLSFPPTRKSKATVRPVPVHSTLPASRLSLGLSSHGAPPDLPHGQSGVYRADSFDSRASVIDPVTGLVQTQTLIPSTSNTYGALGIGISANGTKGDGSGEKKKKKARTDEGEFVCRDCGTVDSPEWRKVRLLCFPRVLCTSLTSSSASQGPEGPKSLCNACGKPRRFGASSLFLCSSCSSPSAGLRYAKLVSKSNKAQKEAKK
ncbi:SPOSA6832_01443 [Sporobolomyces salmonicolor]|uniref:SPOSA6832_01443-mRNA-1:cds n=1 Tax=Sporidiobolus salmonicolor TaxID=5005 RepID=A0A0D6EIQ6_SPOSA|nr:SPOSA6832_01443 [Sporobolomyces salmonicolor]